MRPTDPWEAIEWEFLRGIELDRQQRRRDSYAQMLSCVGKEFGCIPALTERGIALLYQGRKVLEITDYYMRGSYDLALEEHIIRKGLASLGQSSS